jgi:hypothetical protein
MLPETLIIEYFGTFVYSILASIFSLIMVTMLEIPSESKILKNKKG